MMLTLILACPLIAALILAFIPRNYRVVMRGVHYSYCIGDREAD